MNKFDLKKFLEMSGEEQWYWLKDHKYISALYKNTVDKSRKEMLADLAFRLRDEVKDLPDFVWSKAWYLIVAIVRYNYDWDNEELEENWEEWAGSHDAVPDTNDLEIFALYDSKPIHWIAAALEAMKKGQK